MLRITLVSQSEDEVVLKLEGWVSGEGMGVLEEEGSRWLAQTRHLALDLDGVQFIDDMGIALLKRWADHLVLFGAQPFIEMLLEVYGLDRYIDRGIESRLRNLVEAR